MAVITTGPPPPNAMRGESVIKQGQVSAMMSELSDSLEKLHASIERLESRLADVLRPSATNVREELPNIDGVVALAEKVTKCVNSCSRATSTISDITNRLEL